MTHVAAVTAWPLVHLVSPPLVLFYGGFVVFAVATYSVARYGSQRDGVAGGLVMAAALLYFDVRVPELGRPGEIAFHWTVLSVFWGIGRTVHERELRARRGGRVGRARRIVCDAVVMAAARSRAAVGVGRETAAG